MTDLEGNPAELQEARRKALEGIGEARYRLDHLVEDSSKTLPGEFVPPTLEERLSRQRHRTIEQEEELNRPFRGDKNPSGKLHTPWDG